MKLLSGESHFDEKSALVKVIVLCHQAACHYLNQCWPSSMSPYGGTWPWSVLFPQNLIFVHTHFFDFEVNSYIAMVHRNQFHKQFMSTSIKSLKKIPSNLDYNYTIRSQYHTCHDSSTDIACAKLWLDQITIFHTKTTYIFTRFESWAQKPLWNVSQITGANG